MHSFSDVPDSISQGVRDDTSCNRACSQVFLASCPDVRADQGSTAASHCVRLITVEFRGFAAGSPPRGRPSKPPAFRNPPPRGGSNPSAFPRGAWNLGGMSSRSCDRPGGLRKGEGPGAGGMGYGLRCRRGPGDKMRQAGAADPPSGFGHISCMFLFK
jgi:hypothetical protein